MDDPEPKREGGRAARRASDTHQRLVQAALAVFNSQGFDGSTIEDITEKADVGKGTFYRHFHDKHAILNALIETAVNNLERRIVSKSPPPASMEDAIAGIVRIHIAMFRERHDLFLLLLQAQGMLATRKEIFPELRVSFDRYWDVIEKQLVGVATSGSSPENLRTAASAVSGAIFGFVMSGLASMPKDVFATKLDRFSSSVVAGIAQNLRCAV